METSEIEILFYGKDIAEYSVSTQEEVVINGVVKTENPNYLFVTIETKNLSIRGCISIIMLLLE